MKKTTLKEVTSSKELMAEFGKYCHHDPAAMSGILCGG